MTNMKNISVSLLGHSLIFHTINNNKLINKKKTLGEFYKSLILGVIRAQIHEEVRNITCFSSFKVFSKVLC